MLRSIVSPLLEELGKRTTHSPPTIAERIVGHLCYLTGFAVVAAVGLRFGGVLGGSIGTGTLAGAAAGLAVFTFLFLFWAIRYRAIAPERWFVSHLLWLAETFGLVALLITAGLLFLAIGVLLAAIATVMAGLVIYGGYLGAGLIVLWVTWRCVRGYLAYLQNVTVGRSPGA